MKYRKPDMEIIIFSTIDAIVTSGGLGDDPDAEGKDSADW